MSNRNALILDGRMDDPASAVTDATLRKFNVAGFILHLVQGSAMLIASQMVDSIKAFKKDINTNYLGFVEAVPGDPSTRALVSETRFLFRVEIGVLAAVFILLSAFMHICVLTCGWRKYIRDINNGINVFRWYEYAVSSSVRGAGAGSGAAAAAAADSPAAGDDCGHRYPVRMLRLRLPHRHLYLQRYPLTNILHKDPCCELNTEFLTVSKSLLLILT